MSDEKWQIPLALPNKDKMKGKELTVIAGDVGGTKTNLAIYKLTDNNLQMQIDKSYHSAKYSSFIDILKIFISENKLQLPDRICAGVAGPITKGVAEITNLSWELDKKNIQKEAGVEKVHLLNDLEATAFGLAGLKEDDFISICDGDAGVKGNIAIIAPGTGLGEAGLYWDGESSHPFPTEGGHCDFCPRTNFDIDLFHWLEKKYGIVSWEKVVALAFMIFIYS